MPDDMLSFEAFAVTLTRELDLEAALERDQEFIRDLGFDSLRMFELLLVVESLGVTLNEMELGDILDVGDAYHWYTVAADQRMR